MNCGYRQSSFKSSGDVYLHFFFFSRISDELFLCTVFLRIEFHRNVTHSIKIRKI